MNSETLVNRNSTLYHYADAFCINLSGLSLGEDDFLQFVIQQFQRYPNLTTKICFEITETAAISNLESARRFIKELKSIGCRFALDDFGSGLSSFGYLKNLPVDYLKIDGCFVRDIVDDPVDLAMVRSINDIGHLMGTKTIAEFVENDEIKRLLQQLGVDYVQGYGIAKSLPLLELIDAESKCRTNSSVS
jgi:EAL domain-containing protein (putative c-di-GMP-specific phosphodiesterase class I)